MARLKDRQRQVPGGFTFELEPVGFKAPRYASFDVIVDAVTQVINANPDKAKKYAWPTQRDQVANWVDEHNANLCASYGWKDFILDESPQTGQAQYRPDLWPLWARTMHGLRAEGDKGVGDTVERIIGTDNSAKLKSWYQATFGRSCGCDGRKADFNARFPYQ